MHLLSSLLGFLLPRAHAITAGEIYGIIGSVGSALPGMGDFPVSVNGITSEYGIGSIMVSLALQMRPFLAYAAIFTIMYAGYRMVIGQDDNAREKAKTILTMSIAGLILAYLIEPIILAFYGATGEVALGGGACEGVTVLATTVTEFIDWALTILAVAAMLTIIFVALKSVYTYTSDEGVTQLRKTVISIAFGIAVLVLRLAISATLTGNMLCAPAAPSAGILIAKAVNIVAAVLTFVGLAAVAVVIYAGILYLTSFGNEAQAEKGKSLLIRSLIGLVVILLSYGLVVFVIGAVGGT
ncbi:MAG: hypothetical protein WCV62_00795 [Candidatus Peribacteraceae bacterium]|jgi:hypothetical protein